MKRYLFSFGTVGAAAAMLSFAPQLSAAQKNELEDRQSQPRALPLSAEYVGKGSRSVVPTSVQWEGREYDIDAGIDVLMSVVRDPEESADGRGRALAGLVMLDTQLRDRECMEELLTLYHTTGALEKRFILLCFMASDDPRGIPLFIRVLDKEEDTRLRLRAADGLIRWNIRRGLNALMDLLDSSEVLPQPARMPYVRDNAIHLFRIYNARKGWGFPEDEIRKSIEQRSDVNPEETVGLYVRQVREWFAENKQRFPDWKPGDPLPEVTQSGPDDLTGNDASKRGPANAAPSTPGKSDESE